MQNCCSPFWLRFFKAGSDVHRQKILSLIKKQKIINASEIIKKIRLSQPTISHHLKILQGAKLITVDKKGRKMFYSINKKTVASCCLGFMNKFTY